MNQDKSFIEIVDTHLASSNARLPVFNATALRIQQEIAKDESDLQLIEKLIVSDQALTAKVLSVSNSSFYKGLQQVSTVRNAIVRVGINEVSNIVMLITHESNFRSKDPFVQGIMRKLWRHSVACAMGSNWLAKQCGLHSLAHEAFFAGLLHDVGMLFILTVIDDLKHSNEIEIQPSDALLVEAMNTLHTHHGHSLMSHWKLPEKYSQIARDHHQEEFDGNNSLLALVRLADMACCKLGIGLDKDPSLVLIASPEAETLHISEVDLARMEIMLEDSQVFEGGG
ncbi:MAG: HDOD domain-containing protein [Deltaproteobacteria bacterium]|nr:HDOD domain-containing protein [Deltaproteobacteria bacterium]